jgi:hypothetical protein
VLNYVTDQSWIPSSAWQFHQFPDDKSFRNSAGDILDQVPVMSATVLGLEMLLHEPCIDLRMASELVLSDVGATIQILRLIGRDPSFIGERPNRMGDCLAGLDVEDWFGAISARMFLCDEENAAATQFWKHCRVIAQYVQLVAESIDCFSPEDAYLVGLLHGIESLPSVLGWPSFGSDGKDQDILFAMQGMLPPFVLAALSGSNDSAPSAQWKFILSTAHDLVGVRSGGSQPSFSEPTLTADDEGNAGLRPRTTSLSTSSYSVLPIGTRTISMRPSSSDIRSHSASESKVAG